jgi:hypothetical protein
MSNFIGMFIALGSFLDHARLDQKGVKVVLEVDGDLETQRFVDALGDESLRFLSTKPGSTNIIASRHGTICGITFEVRTSPRCPKCHK